VIQTRAEGLCKKFAH